MPPVPVSTIATNLRSISGVNQLQYPSELPKYYMNLLISDYKRQSLLQLGTLNTIASFCLPLPTPLNDAHNVAYDEEPVSQALGTAINAAQNAFGAARPDTQNIGGMQTGAAATASLARSLPVIGNVPGVAQADVIARAFLGIAPNQFMTILLKGPKYKTYEFQWRLSPKTATEAEIIRKMLMNLNNYISPGLASFGAFFTFPKIFNLSFVPNPKYMYKFKPAVCESMTINYAPAGQPAFHRAAEQTGGINAPEGIDLAMRFLELEYWLENDFNDSNFPLDNKFTGATASGPSDIITPSPLPDHGPGPIGVPGENGAPFP